MKAVELRRKTEAELKSLLDDKALRMEELVLLLRQKKAKNVRELREVRRDVARIKTVLREAEV